MALIKQAEDDAMGPKTSLEERQDVNQDAVVGEALSVIDKALAWMIRRELIATGEITDVLLDVRSLLTMPVSDAVEVVPATE